jgi:hypothetical protein
MRQARHVTEKRSGLAVKHGQQAAGLLPKQLVVVAVYLDLVPCRCHSEAQADVPGLMFQPEGQAC